MSKLSSPKIFLNYSGHSGELLTILGKLIHLQVRWRGYRENYFPSSTVSGDLDETHWDTLLTPKPAGGILGKLAETGKG